MSGLSIALLAVQIIAAVVLIILTLLQHGKGADMGAAFGSGSAGSLFGSSGSATFLSRMTSVTVTVFFVSTLAIAYTLSGSQRAGVVEGSSVVDRVEQTAPAIPSDDTAVPDAIAPATGVDQIPE